MTEALFLMKQLLSKLTMSLLLRLIGLKKRMSLDTKDCLFLDLLISRVKTPQAVQMEQKIKDQGKGHQMLIHMAQGNPVGIMQNIRYFIINLCLSIARRLIGDKKDSGDDVDVRPVFKIVIHIKDHEPIEITTFDIYDDFVKMYVDSLYENGF